MEVVLVREPMSNPARTGFAWVVPGTNGAHIQAWLAALVHVPVLRYFPIRAMRHELDHDRFTDFRPGPGVHHDHPDYPEPHLCGRAHSWRSVFTSKHLVSTPEEASTLLRDGRIDVTCEPGSLLDVIR